MRPEPNPFKSRNQSLSRRANVLESHNLSKREPGNQQRAIEIINCWRLGEPKNLNQGVEELESHTQNLCQIATELENHNGQRPNESAR